MTKTNCRRPYTASTSSITTKRNFAVNSFAVPLDKVDAKTHKLFRPIGHAIKYDIRIGNTVCVRAGTEGVRWIPRASHYRWFNEETERWQRMNAYEYKGMVYFIG